MDRRTANNFLIDCGFDFHFEFIQAYGTWIFARLILWLYKMGNFVYTYANRLNYSPSSTSYYYSCLLPAISFLSVFALSLVLGQLIHRNFTLKDNSKVYGHSAIMNELLKQETFKTVVATFESQSILNVLSRFPATSKLSPALVSSVTTNCMKVHILDWTV